MKTVHWYIKPNGECPFETWLESLDRAVKARVYARLTRLQLENYGDHRVLSDGIVELRLMFGPGYRVYCTEQDDRIVILLCGGDKRSQYKDMVQALEFSKDLKSSKRTSILNVS